MATPGTRSSSIWGDSSSVLQLAFSFGDRFASGSSALGLRYGSKHRSDWDCWTVWLRAGVAAAIAVDGSSPVLAPDENPVLAKVLDTFSLSTA
jgi:hypothetical protein